MKNHLSENMRRIRLIQTRCKQRESESAPCVKALWKSEKYANVESKIRLEREAPPLPPRPPSVSYLRAHSRSGPLVRLQSRPFEADPAGKLSVPTASTVNDDRQKAWRAEEEERIVNRPDPDMPPGHRRMPDNERRETLALLLNKERDLVRQLTALPIGCDTVRVRNRRGVVEKDLAEVEEAIKIFSRPKVFVKIDA